MKLGVILVVLAIFVLPVLADGNNTYNETDINLIQQTVLTEYPVNQTWNIYDQNGTHVYDVRIPDIYVKSVPIGLDLTMGMQILQTFSIFVIAVIMVIRSVIMLLSWLSSRRS